MTPEGSDVRPLAEGAYPAWSPDSKWIALIYGYRANSELRVVGRNGEGLRTVLKRPNLRKAAWSPNGTYAVHLQ